MFSQFVLLKAASKLGANFSQVFSSSLPNLNILERTNVLLRSIFFDFNKLKKEKVTSIHSIFSILGSPEISFSLRKKSFAG